MTDRAAFESLKKSLLWRLDDNDDIPVDVQDRYSVQTKLEVMYDVDVKARDFIGTLY